MCPVDGIYFANSIKALFLFMKSFHSCHQAAFIRKDQRSFAALSNSLQSLLLDWNELLATDEGCVVLIDRLFFVNCLT